MGTKLISTDKYEFSTAIDRSYADAFFITLIGLLAHKLFSMSAKACNR
jgi:hypothetical protein